MLQTPFQESAKDSIRLLPDDRAKLVDEIASLLNIKKIGWIFTDLLADDVKKGTVNAIPLIHASFHRRVNLIPLINSISLIYSGKTHSKRRKSFFVCSRVHNGWTFPKPVPEPLSFLS